MKTTILTVILLFSIFDLNAKIVYVEPVQNALYVSIHNCIILGFDETIESSNLSSLIDVSGTLSGIHTGEIILTADKKRLIFKPHQPFAFNEKISVKLNRLKTSFTSNNRLTYTFQTQINKPEWDHNKNMSDESGYSSDNNYIYSDSYSTLPQLTVTISNNPSAGHLFLDNSIVNPYTSHFIIANNDGTTHYTREAPVTDFTKQPNGLISYYRTVVDRKYFTEDSQYNIVDSFDCGNGYVTDGHEFRLLNNGNALLMSYDPQIVDMSVIVQGGNPNAIVTGLIIQEIDVNKNVIFQWRSWDHFSIVDAIHVNLTAASIDCVHGNAIELDNDGNLLISSRHLNEITKINRTTGAMIWRLGGVNNQFTFVNDTLPFKYQHHIRRISNGNITLYDNGNFRPPLFSRALEYQLDEVNKIATLVWQYRNTPVIYGPNRGSVQRLKNGNTLIGWGGTNPTMTEVTSAGSIALEMSLPQSVASYRAFRDEVNLTLNIKLAIEGFYNTQTNKLNIKDTVRAYLRSINSPYNVVDSSTAVIDSVNLMGNFIYYNVTAGTYYISTKHRNSVETWSTAGGESFISGGVYLYDFTGSNSKAYGNNLVLKGSKYCIYSGDVNQDGIVDIADVGFIENDVKIFASGYQASDLTGDRLVDFSDAAIADNNGFNFVGAVTP
ncbi:MAG: aryl-sulfate sulfotransferase [Bacteroidota bacterium]|nr:aryl-sulfate sulfotransferase [Bacteroidota bacterium]